MNSEKKRFVAELSETMPILLETIESGATFKMITAGTSMLPLLRDRKDIVALKKPSFPLKKYEIPLYKRPDGHFVLHRVMKVNKKLSSVLYTMCGDNQFYFERGVKEESVIAVVDHIVRNGKLIKTDSFLYNLYVFLWCRCFFIRFFVLKLRRFSKRIIKKRA